MVAAGVPHGSTSKRMNHYWLLYPVTGCRAHDAHVDIAFLRLDDAVSDLLISLGTDTSVFRPDTVKELVVTGGARLFPSVVLRYFDFIVIGSGSLRDSIAAGLQSSCNAIFQRKTVSTS